MAIVPSITDSAVFHYDLQHPTAETTRFGIEYSYGDLTVDPVKIEPALSLDGGKTFVDIVNDEFTIQQGTRYFSILIKINNDTTTTKDNKVRLIVKPLENLDKFTNPTGMETSVEIITSGAYSLVTVVPTPNNVDEGDFAYLELAFTPILVESASIKLNVVPFSAVGLDIDNFKFSVDNQNWTSINNTFQLTIPAYTSKLYIRFAVLEDQEMLEDDKIEIVITETSGTRKLGGLPLSRIFNLIDKTILPEGAFINWYCDGYNKIGRYSDGIGGYTTALIKENSTECGYVNMPAGTILATYCANYNYYERVADGDGGYTIRIKEENVEGLPPDGCGYVEPTPNTQDELTPTTLNKYGVAILSNDDLGFASLKRDSAKSKYGALFGKWYWEVEVSVPDSTYDPIAIGLVTNGHNMLSWIGATSGSWGWWPFDGTKYHNDTQSLYSSNVNDKDIISVLYDAEGKSLEFWLNGQSMGVAFNGLPDEKLYAAVNAKDDSYCLFNFGQYEFKYAPPSDFKPGFGVVNIPPPEKGSIIRTYCDGYNKKEDIADGHYGYTTRVVKIDDPDCGYSPIPPAGTVLRYYCEGTTRFRVIADGNGGEIVEQIEINSTRCGYVPPPVPALVPATLDPNWRNIQTIIFNDNLTAKIDGSVRATRSVYSGKWYWEVTADDTDIIVGVRSTANTTTTTTIIGSAENEFGWDLSNGKLINGVNSVDINHTVNPGDRIGIALDFVNQRISFSLNGEWLDDMVINDMGIVDYFPIISSNTIAPTDPPQATIHFGDSDLIYPEPIGHVPGYGTTTTIYPRKGTVYNYFCTGLDRYKQLYDGGGGFYSKLFEVNSYSCGWRPPDPAGTLKSTYCVGLDKWGRFADGNYGLYNELIQISHVDCGYRPAGSLISTRCQGFTQIGTYSDGLIPQGSYEQIIEENSRGCGYTDGSGSETPPGGVILDPNLPITYQTGIIISVTPIGLSSDPLIINVPLTP